MILRDIAKQMAQGGTTPAEIANRLKLTREQLSDRLSLMERQGYLEKQSACVPEGESGCGCCHCSSCCRGNESDSAPGVARYVLTAKGRKLAAGPAHPS